MYRKSQLESRTAATPMHGARPIIGEINRQVNQKIVDQVINVMNKSDQKIGMPSLEIQINGTSIMDIPGVHKWTIQN